MPPGGFEPPPLPPEGSALSPELWGPRGVNNRSRSGGWSWTARVAPWTSGRAAWRRGAGPPRASRSHRASVASRCEVPCSVQRCEQRTTCATSHRTEASHRARLPPAWRRGAGPPRASRPHRASVAIPCEVPCPVRRCKRAPRAQPRTRRRPRTVRGRRRAGGAVRARHGSPGRTVRPSRYRARFRVPCGVASSAPRAQPRTGRRPRTVRGRRRAGGAVRARHGSPGRTVRPSRSRARFRVPCGVASSAPHAQPRTGRRPRTVRGGSARQSAGVAVADADGCSAARTASTTGCAPPGSVNSVDCAVIQYGSAKASARPTSPLRAKYPSTR